MKLAGGGDLTEIDTTAFLEQAAEYDRGGKFAALEVPDLLVGDVRAFFRPLR